MDRSKIIYEQLLIKKLESGDPDAFSDIFSAYYKDLVMFAFSFTKEFPDAEEIVQETFVKLWKDRDRIDVRVSLKSMLQKSVQNRFIDWHRHNKIVNGYSSYVMNNSPLFDFDADTYVLRSELEGSIEKAIANLPEKFKEAFEMNRFGGLKYQEIATKLHVSVRTVEVRISKALELLRKDLKDFLK